MMKQWTGRILRIAWAFLRNPWRWIWRGCLIGMAALLLLSCLACLLMVVLVRHADAQGYEDAAGLDVMLAVDNSNSMFDKGGIGSDPELRRIEAAQLFIDYLGVDSSPVSHRLGVIFFGGEAHLVVPLTPLADRARRAEMASLIADPQRMNWTNPSAALSLARGALLSESGSGRQPVVVLLTDGKPEWSNQPIEIERQSTVEELRRIGGQYASDGTRLFVILLANEATDADPEIGAIYVPLWQEIARATAGGFFPVRRADDLIAVYHDILVSLSGVRTDGAVIKTRVEDETQVEMVTVEPNLERLTFVVRVSQPDASTALSTDIVVSVHRPGGQALSPGDADVRHVGQGTTAIWAVTRPEPGEWAVVMSGRGSVIVWKDYLPALATLTPSPVPTATLSPTVAPGITVDGWPEAALVGQPVVFSVSFHPGPSGQLAVWGEWGSGGDQPTRARLLDDGCEGDARAGDGYYGVLLMPTRPGTLLVRVWGEADGRVVALWEGRLRAEARPTLEIVTPQDGSTWKAGEEAELQTRWAVGGRPVEVTGTLTAAVLAPDGSTRAVVTGTVGAPVALSAPQTAGTCTITVAAAGGLPNGLHFDGEAATTVDVRRPAPWWIWPVGLSMVAAGAGCGAVYLRFKRLPRVEGQLRVLEAPASYAGPTLADLSLLNRRVVRLGGKGAEFPAPAGGEPWAIIRALSDGSGVELEPRGGQNVLVNGHELAGAHPLSDGDRVATDSMELRYEHLHYGL
jgi:hypothetical protein